MRKINKNGTGERVLLMTGTIKPFVKVTHNDPEVRLKEYMQAIKKYITESFFDTIIYAENSGYQFDFSELEDMAQEHGKRLVVLSLPTSGENNMSSGEAVLMRQVLECCPFLKDTDVIWKVTGRLWIANINTLLARHKRKTNLFLYSKKYDSLETWLFCAKISDLKQYFLSKDTIDAMRKNCIEYAWMDCFRNHENIKIEKFKCYPNAIGVRSSGEVYTMPGYKRVIFNVLLHLGYFTPRSDRKQIDRDGL